MKRISALILGLLLTSVFILPAWTGTLTTNQFFYKPILGAQGETEKNTFEAGLDRVDTRLGNEIWVGDPKYGRTLQNAITAIGSTQTILRIPAGAYAISGTLVIPANITLKIERGAIFSVGNGSILTINGGMEAGLYQIFSCPGTGKVVFATTGPNVDFYPEWWGAVGGGSTDDLAAFNAAVQCVKDCGKGIIRLTRIYKLSKTLKLENFFNSKLRIIGADRKRTGFISEAYNEPAIEAIGCWNLELANFCIYGTNAAGKVPSVALLMARSTAWASSNANNKVHDLDIYGSYQYGQIYDMNGSHNCYYNLETYTSCPGTDKRWAFGICFEGKRSGANFTPTFPVSTNSNIKTGSGAQTSDNCSVRDSVIMHTGGVPANAAAFYLISSWTNFNNVYMQALAGADADVFRLIGCGSSTFIHCPIESTHRYTFNISNYAAGATTAGIVAKGIKSSATPTLALITDANTELKNCDIDLTGIVAGNIQLGGGASTSTFKQSRTATSFVVSRGAFIGNRVELAPTSGNFDIFGCTNVRNNIITDLRATEPSTTIDGDLRIGQPNAAKPSTLIVSPYKMTWAAKVPTSGSWARGSVIWNTSATPGGCPGWVCIATGTFGTLTSATTGSISVGTNKLVVNDTSGIFVGSFIGIAGIAGTKRVIHIDQATKTVFIDVVANSTVGGAAVGFNQPVFKEMADLAY